MPRKEEPIVWIPPMWVYNRAIVRSLTVSSQTSPTDFVIRRLRLGVCSKTTTLELLTLDEARDPACWDTCARKYTAADFLSQFMATNRSMSIIRAPL